MGSYCACKALGGPANGAVTPCPAPGSGVMPSDVTVAANGKFVMVCGVGYDTPKGGKEWAMEVHYAQCGPNGFQPLDDAGNPIQQALAVDAPPGYYPPQDAVQWAPYADFVTARCNSPTETCLVASPKRNLDFRWYKTISDASDGTGGAVTIEYWKIYADGRQVLAKEQGVGAMEAVFGIDPITGETTAAGKLLGAMMDLVNSQDGIADLREGKPVH